MSTIRVILRNFDDDGKMMTKRYKNARAHVNPTTKVLQVYRSNGPSLDDQEILAEFQPETYLYWE
jgi:transposase